MSVILQFPAYILDNLPNIKNMSSDVFERKMNYTALLGSLLNLYIGPMTLKIDSARAGGLTFISKRTNVPVCQRPLASDASLVTPHSVSGRTCMVMIYSFPSTACHDVPCIMMLRHNTPCHALGC